MNIEGKNTLVLSVSRSGHHAVMNWIISQMKGSVTFYNNCMRGWEQKELLPVKNTNVFKYKNTEHDTHSNIYSIEEFDLDFWEKFGFEVFNNVIIINRSISNWVASRIKGSNDKSIDLFEEYTNISGHDSCSQIDQWSKLMKESLGVTDVITKPKMHICFDWWHQHEHWRKRYAEQLELEFNDNTKDTVSRFGGGSSFQKSQKSSASKLNVTERYIEMENDSVYKRHMNDSRMQEQMKLYIKYRAEG